jgi:hypothetical protein
MNMKKSCSFCAEEGQSKGRFREIKVQIPRKNHEITRHFRVANRQQACVKWLVYAVSVSQKRSFLFK